MIMVKNLAALCGLVLLTVVGTNPGGGVQARAVNISNTWTLPQDGFTVFYRYFRDKISWFEADAVCQFHHANLVTVDNGVQFDAARAFLKELDVTNPVWIGLMRPENSARFTWTNAKTLDPASGYWAESLPAMETPLCAVVDPVRDFRWHALRCGGPETAAFLCELPVPTWATDCTITSMPSLTVQYMSDSGAVQLSRDCGEQGTKHMSCQGKLDRDTILQQLQCSEQEEDPALVQIAATENNQLPVEDQAAVKEKVLSARVPTPPQILEHDILTVVSNNDEDNNIDVNPNQIEDTVKNVINKFNLADLMQNDQSLHSDEAEVRFGEQDKEGKKTAGGKKYSPLFEKKDKYGRKSDKKGEDDEELMMGDQPDETETQPIDIVQQAVKPTEGDSDESSTIGVAGSSSSTEGEPATTSEAAQTESTTVDSRLRRATDSETSSESAITATTELSTTEAPTTTTQEPTTSSTASSHVLPTTPKKEIASVGDHFIPPMLLVKARFTSTKTHDHETTTTEAAESTPETSEATHSSSSFAPEQTSTVLHEETSSVAENDHNDKPSTEGPAVTGVESSTAGHQIVEITFDDHELTSKIGTLSITTRPFISTEQTTVNPVTTTAVDTTSSHNATTQQEVSSTTTNTPITTTTMVVPSSTAAPTTPSSTTTTTAPTTTHPTVTPSPIAPTTSAPTHVEPVPSSEEEHDHENDANEDNDADENGSDEHHDHHSHSGEHNKFSNIENYQPYKPNRHRSLSKSEMHNNRNNYIKKILG